MQHAYICIIRWYNPIAKQIHTKQIHIQNRRTKLASLYPKLATMVLDEENLTLALNEEYVPMGEVLKLKDGDTVALIPPISGG